MDPQFRKKVEALDVKLKQLEAMSPVQRDNLPKGMPQSGIYLFSVGTKHKYVGRSRNLRSRLLEHGRPSSDHYMATFAFRLAREKVGKTIATYKKSGSRSDLERSPAFAKAFDEAKERVARMDIRFVEEDDPTQQALLEIYAAIALGTPPNAFDTH